MLKSDLWIVEMAEHHRQSEGATVRVVSARWQLPVAIDSSPVLIPYDGGWVCIPSSYLGGRPFRIGRRKPRRAAENPPAWLCQVSITPRTDNPDVQADRVRRLVAAIIGREVAATIQARQCDDGNAMCRN